MLNGDVMVYCFLIKIVNDIQNPSDYYLPFFPLYF